MLIKSIDDKSNDIAALQSLLQLPGLTRRQLDDLRTQLDNIRTGWAGEKEAAYFLDITFDEHEHVVLIHDLRLQVGSHAVQIDHLLLTRLGRVYVLESKNLKADLKCNEAGEWTAWYGSKPFAIASPIEQARRHVDLLTRWFKAHAIKIEKIEPVVLVAPTCKFDGKRSKVDQDVPVIRSDLFKRWYQNDRKHESFVGVVWQLATGWSASDLDRYARMLIDSHTPIERNWAGQFGLKSPTALPMRSGVSAQPVPKRAASQKPAPPLPNQIETSCGSVQIKSVSDGRLALRHEPNAALQDIVRLCVGEYGQWQPRFHNWLIQPEHLSEVVTRLRSS